MVTWGQAQQEVLVLATVAHIGQQVANRVAHGELRYLLGTAGVWVKPTRIDETIKACLTGLPEQRTSDPEWWEDPLDALIDEVLTDYGLTDDEEIEATLRCAISRAVHQARAHGRTVLVNRYLVTFTLDDICACRLEQQFSDEDGCRIFVPRL